jgi:hypothetical protein
MLRGLAHGSRPVVVMTAFVAVVGLSGTAYATKTTHALGGGKGDKGDRGAAGAIGALGGQGATGVRGPQGQAGSEGVPGARGLTGPRGLGGANGANGARGANGAAAVTWFAAVAADGTLSASQVRNVASAAEPNPGSGVYTLQLAGSPDVSACVALAQVNDGPGTANTVTGAGGLVQVTTFGVTGAVAEHAFVVTVSC